MKVNFGRLPYEGRGFNTKNTNIRRYFNRQTSKKQRVVDRKEIEMGMDGRGFLRYPSTVVLPCPSKPFLRLTPQNRVDNATYTPK